MRGNCHLNYELLLDYAKSYYEYALEKKENYMKKIYVTFIAFIVFLSLAIPLAIFFYMLEGLNHEDNLNLTVYALMISILFIILISFMIFYIIAHIKSKNLISPDTIIKQPSIVGVEDMMRKYPNINLDKLNLDEKSYLELIYEYNKKSQSIHFDIDRLYKLYNVIFMLLSIAMTLMIATLIILM